MWLTMWLGSPVFLTLVYILKYAWLVVVGVATCSQIRWSVALYVDGVCRGSSCGGGPGIGAGFFIFYVLSSLITLECQYFIVVGPVCERLWECHLVKVLLHLIVLICGLFLQTPLLVVAVHLPMVVDFLYLLEHQVQMWANFSELGPWLAVKLGQTIRLVKICLDHVRQVSQSYSVAIITRLPFHHLDTIHEGFVDLGLLGKVIGE